MPNSNFEQKNNELSTTDTCDLLHNNKRKMDETSDIENQSKNKKQFTDCDERQQTVETAHDFLKKLLHEQKLHAPTLFNRDEKNDCEFNQPQSNTGDVNDIIESDASQSNGKLSFFLDGRFVLELVHKAAGKSNSGGGWIQTKGITWTPSREADKVTATTTINSKHSNEINTSVVLVQQTESNRVKLKDISRFSSRDRVEVTANSSHVALFTFHINRRRDYKQLPRINVYRVRKAARSPFALDLFMLCKTEKCDEFRRSTKVISKRTRNLNDLFSASKCLNVKSEHDASNTNSNSNSSVRDETEGKNNSLPLPEWYLDPSKAQIPVSEMIGYPRPYLPSTDVRYGRMMSLSQHDQIRNSLVGYLLDRGGDVTSRYISSEILTQAASKFKLSVCEVSHLWLHHCISKTNTEEKFSNPVLKAQCSVESNKNHFVNDCVNQVDGPLDLRVNMIRKTISSECKESVENSFLRKKIKDESKETVCCHKQHVKENARNAFYLGLIPVASNYSPIAFPLHGEYSSPSSVGSWPCCPVVAYAPTVVNSYYYCCCYLPGCRSNCLCKTEKRSVENGISNSLEKKELNKSECLTNCATDLTKTCNKKCSSLSSENASGSMLKDLLLMPPLEKESDVMKSSSP